VELYELTVHEMSDFIKNRKVSAVELVQSVLDRINAIDEKIGSYITVLEEDALEQAKEVQERIDKGEAKSPLAGIPMALKDNICTKNVKTTCASKMLGSFIPPYDATVSKKLYNEGAVLLGKLNMDEFAMGRPLKILILKLHEIHGTLKGSGRFQRRFGCCCCAGMAGFALVPIRGLNKAACFFLRHRRYETHYGAVSRFGLVAFASSMDQIGPLTKDVTDCAMVLNAITGYDPMDSTSADVKYPDYSKALINDVKGIRIGIPKNISVTTQILM